MTDSGSSVRLTIPAKAEYITLGRLALTAIAGVRPLSDETLHDLKLALTEACTNSVRHAYVDGGEGEVEILYELEPDRLVVEVVYELRPDRLVVEVADDGPGFDAAGDRALGDGLAEGGLGIAIIQAVSDEFEAGKQAHGGGSRLRFVKLLEQ